jgi:hypothetical protein
MELFPEQFSGFAESAQELPLFGALASAAATQLPGFG